MKTTLRIFVAAFLLGTSGLSHFAHAKPVSVSSHCFSLTYEQAMQILSAAHQQYWYDEITMADLVAQYDQGICTIEKVENGYKVTAGGLGTELILSTF